MKTFNADTVIARLIEWGDITRTSRGKYRVNVLPDDCCVSDLLNLSPMYVISLFTTKVDEGRYVFKSPDRQLRASTRRNRTRPFRNLDILPYGSSNHGNQYEVEDALERIPFDDDGVRRSFGVEYEIYTTTAKQRSDLAYLLDTLPHSTCHRDGSLGDGGVEVVFDPVGADDYVRIVTTLGTFVKSHNIEMEYSRDHGAGMHTTYGVNNTEINDQMDLQIRLNRCMVMMRACMTQEATRKVFGRFFTDYARLPDIQTMGTISHSNAASTNGRPSCCWEFRLPNWKADPRKVIKFFRATEWVFHHIPTGNDMAKMAKLFADWNQD